jgi:hypothetical protein
MKYTIQAIDGTIPGAHTWRFDNRQAAEIAASDLCKKHNVKIEVSCVLSTVSNVTIVTRHDKQNDGGE